MGDHRIGDRVRVSDGEGERKSYRANLRGREGAMVGIDPTQRTHAVSFEGEVHLLLVEKVVRVDPRRPEGR